MHKAAGSNKWAKNCRQLLNAKSNWWSTSSSSAYFHLAVHSAKTCVSCGASFLQRKTQYSTSFLQLGLRSCMFSVLSCRQNHWIKVSEHDFSRIPKVFQHDIAINNMQEYESTCIYNSIIIHNASNHVKKTDCMILLSLGNLAKKNIGKYSPVLHHFY